MRGQQRMDGKRIPCRVLQSRRQHLPLLGDAPGNAQKAVQEEVTITLLNQYRFHCGPVRLNCIYLLLLMND